MTSKVNIEDNTLTCPLCQGTYLHQLSVDVFNAGENVQEDSLYHIRTNNPYSETESILRNKDFSQNPSPYRQGLLIGFICEDCSEDENQQKEILKLEIYQHKGRTYMDWRKI